MLDWIREAFQFLTNVEALIRWGGTAMVCAVVFVETGLFVGFFLPGDSLLVTAGVFAAAGLVDVLPLLFLTTLCAIVGDQLGYFIGYKAGKALYQRPDSLFFKKRHLQQAHDFYEKYGVGAIILARFVPIVRTFCPPVAGAARMNYRRYLLFDIAGGFLWVWSMVLLGYFLGRSVPNISQRIHYVIAVVVFLSLLPPIIGVLRHRRQSSRSGGVAAPGAERETE